MTHRLWNSRQCMTWFETTSLDTARVPSDHKTINQQVWVWLQGMLWYLMAGWISHVAFYRKWDTWSIVYTCTHCKTNEQKETSICSYLHGYTHSPNTLPELDSNDLRFIHDIWRSKKLLFQNSAWRLRRRDTVRTTNSIEFNCRKTLVRDSVTTWGITSVEMQPVKPWDLQLHWCRGVGGRVYYIETTSD